MQNYLAPSQVCNSQECAIKNYGDGLLEWLREAYKIKFSTFEAMQYPGFKHLSDFTKRKYVRAILKNMELEAMKKRKKAPFRRWSSRRSLIIWN